MIIGVDDACARSAACRPANGAAPPPLRHRSRVPGCRGRRCVRSSPIPARRRLRGCAIRNPTAPICCASPSLTRRCTCAGRERIFVADHDDPARMRFACRSKSACSAQAEVEDFRHEPRGRCRAQQRRAGERRARRRAGQLRRPAPPTGIFHGILANLCARHGREPLRGRRPGPRLRSPSPRGGRRDAHSAWKSAHISGSSRLAGGDSGGSADAAPVTGALIPTDLTISAQRAVSLSIRARNWRAEAWDAVTPSGTRRDAKLGRVRARL